MKKSKLEVFKKFKIFLSKEEKAKRKIEQKEKVALNQAMSYTMNKNKIKSEIMQTLLEKVKEYKEAENGKIVKNDRTI